MIYYKRLKKSLIAIPVSYEDIELNSPTFFNITYTPSYFTAGKNIIKYNPNFKTLSTENPIEIEILDSSGNTIYHSDVYYEEINGSNIISAYVYQDVNVGNCTITFIGTRKSAFKLDKNKLVRYTHKLNVKLLAPNRDDIIYTYRPVVSLSERKYSILEEKFTSNKNIIVSGSAAFQYLDGKNILFSTSQSFSKDFENGILSFPNLSNTHLPNITESTNSFSYSASVVSVNLPSQMELDSRPVVNGQSGVDYNIVESYNQPYVLNYYKSSTDRNVTQNIKNYIKIDIDGLDPSTGYVSRIKVLGKSKINPASDYKTLYDYKVNQNNILIDSSSDFIDFSIGEFKDYTNLTRAGIQTSVTKSAIDYWNVTSINSAPTASKTFYSSNLFNGITITTATKLSSSQYIMLEQTGSSAFNLYNDTLYILKFDYLIDKEKTTTPTINVYMSGSATFADTEYGKYLGGVDTSTDDFSAFVSNFSIPIYTVNNGNGILKFLISEGIILQNIRVEEVIDRGFTPNRTTLYVPIDQNHKFEYWDFVIKYFNDDYTEANIDSSVNNIFIEGGNQYIYGDNNIITGSTYISSYTASGIQLYGNISGSKSGSAIQSYGYNSIEFARTGTPVTNNYGWSLTQGNPYSSASYSTATVQMINQSGSSFEFRSNPDTFKFNAVGSNSSVLIGNSGSISSSYLKWDGTDLVVYASGSKLTTATGSFTGSFTGSLQGSASYSTTASYVNTLNQNINIVPPSTGTNHAILVSGSNTVGGSTYIDFLKVSNSTSPITNPNKSFRLDQEGTFQIIDSGYANTIWSLTDTGIVRIPSAAGKTTQLIATGSVITFNTSGGQIFDDGNFHIHSLNPNANLWLNASGSGKIVINAETGATGGMCIGTSTQSGYVTISGSVNATYSYAYLANLNPAPPTGYSSGTNPYSLTANQRIQAAEFDATSDERLKNIIGNIELVDAIRLVKVVEPIQFTWKDEIDKGIKTGYSAQQLIKTGFEHMVGAVPKSGLEETIDNDGFISPKDTQLVVNTDQITAYHSLLIKHLLERIEDLEKRLLVSDN